MSTKAVILCSEGAQFALWKHVENGADATVLPVFTAPALPAGVAAVPPGALTRLFDLIREIKEANAYTEAIGLDLGIVGSPDTASHPAPGLRAEAVQGTGCQCVRLPFQKWGHQGVTIESRRGGGNFEQLAIDTESPYLDERPCSSPASPKSANTAPASGTKAPPMAIGPMW